MRLRNQKGITLVEIIIAFGILSILTLATTGFFSYGLKNFQKTNEIVDEQSQLRMASNRVSQLLRNAKDVQLLALESVPTGDTSTPFYIYTVDGKLVYRDDAVSFILMEDFSPTISFSVTDGDKVMVGFTITTNTGYSIDSSVMLNNYGDNVDEGQIFSGATSGDAVRFVLPES